MERAFNLHFEQAGEFAATRDRARPGGEVLKNHACVVRAAEECPVDALSAALYHRRGNPYQGDPEDGAQRHARVAALREESREGMGEERDGCSGSHEKQNVESALYQHVTGAAAE